LAKAVQLPEIVDSAYPIRIIFLILGPSISDGSYHELGRSLGTLMANKVDFKINSISKMYKTYSNLNLIN